MDFSAKLDDLQQHAAHAKAAAQAAVSESREQLRQRIDQARVDVDLAAMDTRQQVGEAAASARSTWAQIKADTAAKLDDSRSEDGQAGRPAGCQACRPPGRRGGG